MKIIFFGDIIIISILYLQQHFTIILYNRNSTHVCMTHKGIRGHNIGTWAPYNLVNVDQNQIDLIAYNV